MLGPSAVVMGIGLNFRLSEQAHDRIDQVASDLNSVKEPPERNQVLAVSLRHLVRILNEFGAHGFSPMRAEWERHHVFQLKAVKMLLPDGSTVSGTVSGVTNDGALRLETAQGERVFNAGEVSLRSA
jgi:BirA family biotin operon repressor/biotin-[acetyl-CoA-carboxylase] ligase